jgi:lipoprotein NlpD
MIMMRYDSPVREALLAVAVVIALAGCATGEVAAPAEVVDRSPPSPGVTKQPAAKPGGTHVVARGETLYSIALEHGVDYRELAQWNNLEDAARIRVGQVLRLAPPGGREPAPRAAPASEVQVGAAPGVGPVESRSLDTTPMPARKVQIETGAKTSPKALRLPYSQENLALLSKGDERAQGAPAASAVVRPAAPRPSGDPDAIEFIWPAKGRLLAGFVEPSNRGVDIGGRIGDPIVAAAPGRVTYTGSGIRGYGKLIIIRHENGFNSVYAHNKEVLVKEGQTVARGQKIAELGDSDSDKPKLHFEIRKSGKPVDPLRYLPGDRPS